MKNSKLVKRLLFLFNVFLLINIQIYCIPIFDKVPSITSVVRLDENSLKVTWHIDEDADSNLLRYRIFYSKANDDHLYEWPGQIKRVENDVIGTNYRSFWYKNSFECYTACVKNPSCIFATFKSFVNKLESHPTCYMKTRLDKSIASVDVFNSNTADEYVEITEYQNEAIIRGLPTHIEYIFTVMVYDKTIDAWSQESADYLYKPSNLESKLRYDFFDGHTFSWTQPRSGMDTFTISRYNLFLWTEGNENNKEKISIKDAIIKYKFDPDYYSTKEDPIYSPSENHCHQNCLTKSNCIRYVFIKSGESCYLLSKLELNKAHLIPKNSIAYSLTREGTEFNIDTLKSYSTYYAQLEYITPYGLSGFSNGLRFQTEENGNVNIDTIEEVDLKPTESWPPEPPEEPMPPAPPVIVIETVRPIPDVVDEIEKEAEPTTTTTTPTIDVVGGGESNEIDEYLEVPDGGVSGGGSDIEDGGENDDGALELNQLSSQTKRVNERFEIECTFRGGSAAKRTLVWVRKGDESGEELNTEVTKSKDGTAKVITNKLTFASLTRKHNGVYSCYAQENPFDVLNLNLNVKDVPSKPIIVKASASQTSTFLKWTVEDDGGLQPIKGVVELSENFDDSDSKIEAFELNNDDLKLGEVELRDKLVVQKASYVRIYLENAIGNSEKSDPYKIVADDEDEKITNEPIVLGPAEVVGGGGGESAAATVVPVNPDVVTNASSTLNVNKQEPTVPQQKPKVFGLVLIGAIVLFVIILAYGIYRCKFANKSSNEKDASVDKKNQADGDEKENLVAKKQ